ncbi:MAG: hypothetical protein QXO75_07840 [Nitrososphaerota archaeon]
MRQLQKLLEEALKATLEESRELKDVMATAPETSAKLDMRRLKDFAIRNLPEDSKLRILILSEKDELDAKEFVAKVSVWLKLLTLES